MNRKDDVYPKHKITNNQKFTYDSGSECDYSKSLG